MDQYPPYSIQQQPPVTAAAASYPYPDGPQPEKNPSDGVAQMAQNPYYQVPVDPQVNFTGGFVPAEVSVPNGMVPQPAYNSYYPEQVPQQQQQLAGPEPPVQYSQQDYAREANVAPVEYLPEVGMPAIQQGTGSVQLVEQSAEGVANVASAPGFCEQIQQGMDLPQAVASGEIGSTVLVNDKEQQLVGSGKF